MSSLAVVQLSPSCHCRVWSPVTVAVSALPLRATACHCRACRQATGNIAAYLVSLPPGTGYTFSSEDQVALRRYKSSGHMTRCFCSMCGAKIAEAFSEDTIETLFLGVLPGTLPSGEPTYKLRRHIFVQVEDGGGLLRYCNDGVPRFALWHENSPVDTRLWVQPIEPLSKKLDVLPLRCHCGRFQASLKRPSACADQTNPVFKFVKDDKWGWSLDFCTSCRTTSGAPFACFILTTPDALVLADGMGPFTTPLLTRYESSKDTWRSFCPTCGASVFYENRRPGDSSGVVEPCLGLVDVPLKTVFDEWVHRMEDVREFLGDAEYKDIADSVVEGWEKSKFA